MKLLLHACCGPCSLEPVRLLHEAGYDLTIYYANSNIAPDAEYSRRLDALLAWAKEEDVAVLKGLRAPCAWEASAGRIGEEALSETRERLAASSDGARPLPLAIDPARRMERCRACYRLRFEETALVAAAHGFDGIGTTLSVSPYQYTEIIHEELSSAAARFGVSAVFRDFRPYYDEATRRSREAGMYRQNYCGCRFSAAEAEAERSERKAAREAAREADRAAHAAEREAAEAERTAKRAERLAYDEKQARKRAVLKALRTQEKDASQ